VCTNVLQLVYAIYAVLPGDDDKLPYIALLSLFVPLGWTGEAVWTVIFNQQVRQLHSFGTHLKTARLCVCVCVYSSRNQLPHPWRS
jgi:hypothetical protein